jgi:hypothetical protein
MLLHLYCIYLSFNIKSFDRADRADRALEYVSFSHGVSVKTSGLVSELDALVAWIIGQSL